MNEDHTPIIVGTGQLVDREASVERHIEPLDMLVQVAKSAAEDAGLTQADTVMAVVGRSPAAVPIFT